MLTSAWNALKFWAKVSILAMPISIMAGCEIHARYEHRPSATIANGLERFAVVYYMLPSGERIISIADHGNTAEVLCFDGEHGLQCWKVEK